MIETYHSIPSTKVLWKGLSDMFQSLLDHPYINFPGTLIYESEINRSENS